MRASVVYSVGALISITLSAYSAPLVYASDPRDQVELKTAYRRPSEIPHPDENRYTPEREKLGKTLFFDPRLSVSGFISCGTCHNPAFAWGDGLPRAIGHGMKTLGRRTPTILNLAWAPSLFWDGRADTLEDQALGPIQAPGEMNMPIGDLLARIKSLPEYGPLFELAYPGEGVSQKTIAKAISVYERTVVSGVSPFDQYIAGNERALTASQKRGFALFNGKANCAACHSSWRFTDDSFHDIGVPGEDLGRGAFLEIEELNYAFKTPTLRNVDRRAPFMHDGSEATLMSVIELYDAGGRVRRPTLSDEIKKLGLTSSEKQDLVEFLKALTSVDDPVMVPAAPR